MPHFLDELRIQGIRGIDDLRVVFNYPVSVIAGGNASGKTTVLFAAACAYKVPSAGVKDYVPSTLFPDYRPKDGKREDERPRVTIEFYYATPSGRQSMIWRRNKGWNRSFMGRKGAVQPERELYLRTLSNLSNPSEVRGVLSMSRLNSPPSETSLTASQRRNSPSAFCRSDIRKSSTCPATAKTCCSPPKTAARRTPSCTWRPENAPFSDSPKKQPSCATRRY